MVSWGKSISRIDPSAYHPDCEAARDAISKMPFDVHPLQTQAKFEKRVPGGQTYVGLEHISSGTGVACEFADAEKMAAGVGFLSGDVLFPKLRPYLNKVWLADRDGMCSSEFHVLTARTALTPEFLAIFLRSSFIVRQTSRLMTGTTLPRLQTDDIRRLLIPTPPQEIQSKISAVWNSGLAKRAASIAEADALLVSIDDYLLTELGITLPPEPENTIDKRMFRAEASDLGGWRFDPRVHQYDFNLVSATHPNAKLGTICAINPKTVFRGLTDKDAVSFVPMDTISDRLGIIEKPKTRVLTENVGYTFFREGDLLWAKITPCMENGKSAVAESLCNGFGYGSTEYHVLRSPDGSLDMGYLHALLRMKRVRKAAVRFFTGASGHQRVDADFLRTLELPVPPLGVQKKLAEEARLRVAKAVQLEEEANAELEQAKRDIEAILLGEAV